MAAIEGTYVPGKGNGCCIDMMMMCSPGMSMQVVAKDADTVAMVNQKCCWIIPLGGCPLPFMNLCGCGPLAFAPEFKKGIIPEQPDSYVGDGPMYAGRCCGGCPCCSNYSDVVKLENGTFGYYPNFAPFCGKGICCNSPSTIDQAAALKAGSAKAPMMKMIKRDQTASQKV